MRYLFIQMVSNLTNIHRRERWFFSPDLNLRIVHKLPSEASVFSTEAWAILLVLNVSLDLTCSKSITFSDSKCIGGDALTSPLSPNKNYIIHRIKKRLLDVTQENKEIIVLTSNAQRYSWKRDC